MNDRKRRKSAGSGGIGLPMLLFIIFLILKLTNVIDWSWWWVTAPLWISAALGILFFLFIGFVLFLALIGILGAGSAVVVGIKSWFGKAEQEGIFEEKTEEYE